jgi:hypothetical protein
MLYVWFLPVVTTVDIFKFLVLKVIVLGSAEPFFYDLSSFIKRDPVSTIIVGLWMKYYNLAIVPIPGMIPRLRVPLQYLYAQHGRTKKTGRDSRLALSIPVLLFNL